MINENLKLKAEEFAGALKATGIYNNFIVALNDYNNDGELRNLRIQFARLKNQTNGNAEALEELKSVQEKINSHPALLKYLSAQKELIEFLQKCNSIISEKIQIDFAKNSAASCCG